MTKRKPLSEHKPDGRPRTQPLVCVAPGCDRRAFARDLCRAHYSRVRRSPGARLDKPVGPMRPPGFFGYVVDAETGCWEWTGSRDHRGYGKRSVHWAHRLSYEKFKGPIPKGKLVCHSCDNPGCVNPDHLWLGTNKDNSQDMLAKGRARNGATAARRPA